LHFHGSLSALTGLADWPGLERVGRLRLTGPGLTPGGLGRFLASPRLRNLTALEFENVPALGPAALRALAESPVWPRLARLEFGLCHLSRGTVRTLVDVPPAPNLLELKVQEPYRDTAVGLLAGARLLATVRDLDLWATSIGSAGVTALAENSRLIALRRLDLSGIGAVSRQAVERLARAPALANLCSLAIGNLTAPDAALALLESPTLARLRELMVVHSHRAEMSAAVRRKMRARFGPESVLQEAS
jgi:hypothetical protein